MNFLAHAYLSFGDAEVLAGNMTSDFIKGKKQYDFTGRYFEGIKLHRAIDAFTDTHPINLKVKSIFQKAYGLYSGAFLDISYDYFLANDRSVFPDNGALADFVQTVYQQLKQQEQKFPDTFKPVFAHMQAHNWLFHYHEPWGIEKSFNGLVHRAKYMHEASTAFGIFNQHQPILAEAYEAFFPLLKNEAYRIFQNILPHD